jgi:hypothetical protein
MRPWIRDDLEAVLEKNKRRLRFGPEHPTKPLADAIIAIPLLNALVSNGRSAFFLVEAIESLSDRMKSLEEVRWLPQLSERCSTIVESVVRRYSRTNGLSTLDQSQRPRVGAWVLGALSRLKIDDATPPQLDGLCAMERSKAALLYQENSLKSGTGLVLGPKQRFSASVSPALAIVLLDLLGVLSAVLAGWKGGEEVAVLYAARQWVLGCWSSHAGEINRLQNGYDPNRDRKTLSEFESGLASMRSRYELDRDALEAKFGLSLKQLRLFRLQKQIQSPEKSSVRIPMAPKDSIFLNAERAKFADVIAPYTSHPSQVQYHPEEDDEGGLAGRASKVQPPPRLQ